jgi:hypothetical protein
VAVIELASQQFRQNFVLYCTVLTVPVGLLHCHSCGGKDVAFLWADCDFQLRGSWKVIRNWGLIKYTLEIA